MTRKETIFNAETVITPDFAARLAQCAARHSVKVYLEQGQVRLCVDSLIGILSMNLRRGASLTVEAEGENAVKATEEICALLNGKAS